MVRQRRLSRIRANAMALFAGLLIVVATCRGWSQNVPLAPNAPWRSPQERFIQQDARKVLSKEFTVDSAKTYSLGELIDLAEAHNPEARWAWEQALSQDAQ